ncbi:hypothetical protein T05_10666, partial [Trichinella murrelli]
MPIKSIFGRKGKYRDLCNWGRRKYVCCTYLIIFYQLISIKPIFRGKGFSQKLQNFMGYIDLLCMINGPAAISFFYFSNHFRSIEGPKALFWIPRCFSKIANFMGYRLDFHNSPNRLSQRRMKLYAVKYLKSYFWTTMTEERLNGLAVMRTSILTFPLIFT